MLNSKTGLLFGPAGSIAGIVLLIAGVSVIASWVGILLSTLGVFFAASYSGTLINLSDRYIKQYTALFGLIKVGDKENLEEYTALAIIPDNEKYFVYSQGNRIMDTATGKLVIVLVNEITYQQVTIGKYKTFAKASQEIKDLSNKLKIPIINIITND